MEPTNKTCTKIKIYKSIVESIVTYGAEVWATTEQLKKKLRATEMGYWRRCCQLTIQDKIRNEDVLARLNIGTTILDTVEAKCLRWYGHVRRMDEGRWPKKIIEWTPAERRRRGRPRTLWKDAVNKAMDGRNLQENDWKDRSKWKLGCDKRL